jgi:hypothetical protein
MRTDHPWSRWYRFSSPRIVGIAYDSKDTPRSASNRSTALSSPIDAIWTRSSSG